MIWKLSLLEHNEEVPATIHTIELEAGNLPQACMLSETFIIAAYPSANLSFRRPQVEDKVIFLVANVDREHQYLDGALTFGLEPA